MLKRPRAVLSLLVSVVSCGTVDHGSPDAGQANADSAPGTELIIEVRPSSFLIAPGGTAELEISVARPAGTPQVVDVALSELSPDLVAVPLSIAPDSSSAILSIEANPTAPQAEIVATIEAVMGEMTATTSVTVVISGPPGSLDLGFATNGIFRGPIESCGRAVLRTTDGFVVVGASGGQLFLAKLLNDGALDSTFGEGGTVVSDFPDGALGRGAAIDSDGNIVVAGSSFDGAGVEHATLFRFSSDGVRDSSFGNGGMSIVAVGDAAGPLISVHVEDTGDYIAGAANPPVLVRFSSGGTTISNLGLVSPNSSASLSATLIETNGAVVTAARGSGNEQVTARRTPDAIDSTFAEAVLATASQSNGIVAVDDGYVVGGIGSAALQLVRLSSDGNLDASFGANGVKSNVAAVVAPSDATNNMAVDSQGRLLFGAKQRVSGGNIVVVRVLGSGVVDASFSGTLVSDQGAGTVAGITHDELGRVIAVGDADGQLIVGRLWP